MKHRVTSKRNKRGSYNPELPSYDNKLIITNLAVKDWEQIESIIDDNSGEIIRRVPLTVVIPDCMTKWYSVEVDNMLMNLQELETKEVIQKL